MTIHAQELNRIINSCMYTSLSKLKYASYFFEVVIYAHLVID